MGGLNHSVIIDPTADKKTTTNKDCLHSFVLLLLVQHHLRKLWSIRNSRGKERERFEFQPMSKKKEKKKRVRRDVDVWMRAAEGSNPPAISTLGGGLLKTSTPEAAVNAPPPS